MKQLTDIFSFITHIKLESAYSNYDGKRMMNVTKLEVFDSFLKQQKEKTQISFSFLVVKMMVL